MPKNILITDYYCASNRGDAAIFEGVSQALERVFPRAEIDTLTESPEAFKMVHGSEANEQKMAGFRWEVSKKNLARVYFLLAGQASNTVITPLGFDYAKDRANLKPYFEADLVISTGGHYLTDIYFPSKVAVLWEHYFLKQINTPVVIYAQSLGPFTRSPYKQMVKRVLNSIDLIITRDRQSKQIVKKMGIGTPIHFTADAAFSMDIEPKHTAPLDRLGAKDKFPKTSGGNISISVRNWSRTNEGTTTEDYLKAIASTADWLIEEMDKDVYFISTCTGLAGYHRDDRVVAAKVQEHMKSVNQNRVRIFSGEYTPQQLIEIYNHMDLHIGMRMHSNILALMAETPTVAIQYQFKTKGLMKIFDLMEYTIDVNKLEAEKLINIVNNALSNSESMKKVIKNRLPKVKKESDRSAELVKEYLD